MTTGLNIPKIQILAFRYVNFTPHPAIKPTEIQAECNYLIGKRLREMVSDLAFFFQNWWVTEIPVKIHFGPGDHYNIQIWIHGTATPWPNGTTEDERRGIARAIQKDFTPEQAFNGVMPTIKSYPST
jgi:hypothetical protein